MLRSRKARSDRPRSRARQTQPGTHIKRPLGYSYYQDNATGGRERGGDRPASNSRLSAKSANWLKLTAFVVALLVIVGLELPVSLPPKIIIQGGGSAGSAAIASNYQAASEHILESWGPLTKLTLNRSKLELEMKQRFPEVASAKLTYSALRWQPTLTLTLYQPSLVLVNPTGQYLISANGVVISKLSAAQMPGLPRVDDNSDLTLRAGRAALPQDYVGFITDIISQLDRGNSTVSRASLPAASTELDISVKGQGYFVKFNLRQPVRQQLGTYLAAKHYLESHNIAVHHYIDARLPGRVYYQ